MIRCWLILRGTLFVLSFVGFRICDVSIELALTIPSLIIAYIKLCYIKHLIFAAVGPLSPPPPPPHTYIVVHAEFDYWCYFNISVIIGADRIEQSVVCSRQVNKTTGQIIISVNWQGNFSHLPPSYYGDTLDSTRLSVFRGNVNSTLRDRGIERRLMIATFIDGLGKRQLTHRFRDNSTALSQLEVRANGSGVIHLLGLSPFVLGVYDHFLLLVSVN